jgi:hypothetical protein
MDRRKFIASASVAVGMGVAGCSALSGSGKKENGSGSTSNESEGTPTPELTTVSENASFARLNIGGPSNVTVGDSFNLPISVTNVGGRNGTFSGKLVITKGSENLNRTFTIENIGSLETGNAMIKSLNFTHADTYTFSIEGTDVTKTVTVEPVTLPLGGSYTLDNGLKITIQSATFQPALFYTKSGYQEDAKQAKLLSAGSGRTLMIVQLAVENVSTEPVEFDIVQETGWESEPSSRSILIENGNWYTSFPNDVAFSKMKNGEERPMISAQLQPGAQTSGWVVGQLSRKAAKQTVSIIHQQNGGKTPPEVQWQIPPQSGSKRSFPNFSLDTFKMPKSSEIAADVPYTVKVTNKGAAPGTFRGILQFNTKQSQEYAEVATLSAKLKPGESKTFKGTHKWWYVTSNTYRLRPFGKTQTVEMKPASLRYGQTYTARFGRKITVSKPTVASTVNFPGQYAGPIKVGPSQQWVLAKVKAAIPDTEAYPPDREMFTLQVGDQSYETTQPGIGEDQFSTPVDGDLYGPTRDEAVPGSPATGYIAFKTPSNIPVKDMSVQLKIDAIDYPPYIVNWGGAQATTQ